MLSVTSGSMHYKVQDELSDATFMYMYVWHMCVWREQVK